jgi:hypothetical protein
VKSEDELLAEALGGVAGGRRGVESVARRMRKNVAEVDVVLDVPSAAAADRARKVLSEMGRVIGSEGTAEPSGQRVTGIVGAGVANLNPTVVTVTIRATEAGSEIVVRGAAKEGLIKQRAGEAAAKRVAAALA